MTTPAHTLPPYPAYRPAGVEWLDAVPAHWDISQAKHQYSMQLGKMLQNYRNQPADQIVPYLKAAHVQWFAVHTDDAPAMWATPGEIERYGIRKGDLLVCEGGEGGRCAIVGEVPDNCIIQNALHRVRPLRGNSIGYLQYTMRAIAQSGWLEAINNKATIAHFTGEKFRSLRIPVPPPDEQAAIASYLDHVVDRINRARQGKARLAELLQEYRQAAIHQAVTRGLNPDAPLKPSGVKWLDDVPAHWEIRRLKYCATLIMGQSPSAFDCSDQPIGLPFLQGCAEFGPMYPTPAQFCREPKKVAPADAILLSVRAPVGQLNISDQPYAIGRGLCAILPLDHICQRQFAYYHLLALPHDLRAASAGTTYDAVRVRDVGNQPIILPPPDEQAAIAAHLDQLTAKLDAAIAGARQSAALLDEYRAALIAAAVTGQVDVRAAAGPLTSAG